MHTKTVEDILKALQTREQGLTAEEVETRRQEFGFNKIQAKKRTPLIMQFFAEFADLMVIILIVAAAIAGFSGELTDAGVILFIVILNAIIGFIQKFKAEKALEALQKLMSPHARVLRGGEEIQIDAAELVPGDIVILNEGDRVPADLRLTNENELEVDESPLTGESIPVVKDIKAIDASHAELAAHTCMAFMGTQITHGTARGVVTAIGMNTEFGRIARLTTETEKEKSPLQKELLHIGVFVGKTTLVISAILIAIGYFIQNERFIDTFLFATAVAVAAVPEGLPATITIALALGVQRLAKKNAIVKQLASVETLGSTTVICSDKTGTLTKNQMTVKEIAFDTFEAEISGAGYAPIGAMRIHNTKTMADYEHVREKIADLEKNLPQLSKSLHYLMRTIALCTNAKLRTKGGTTEMLGDPTEGALLTLVEKSGFHLDDFAAQYKKIFELPFDSERKRMTVISQETATREVFASVKGAPDSLLPLCTHMLVNGEIVPMDEKSRQDILARNEAMAKRALRVIAAAYRTLPAQVQEKYKGDEIERELIYVGLNGMIDPPREEVKEAVRLTQKAGIKIYIITGDYGLTAHAIARELGIVGSYQVSIITGDQLNKLDDKKLEELLADRKKEVIFARVNPEHKLKIVSALKSHGEVVAVTGDGVNDAPALKRADIGVAMGITGTDVSKEAANMVLADDSFATIVHAIEEGRAIYDNMKKFVYYIFSCNVGELTTIFAALAMGLPAPLTAILILAVDLGTDVLPALALGVDTPAKDIMGRRPRDPKERIMDKKFIARFILMGSLIGITVVATYFWSLHRYGWEWGTELAKTDMAYLKASTTAFTLLVFIQMVNAWNARSRTESVFSIGIFANKHLLGAVAISLITVVAFVEFPFFQKFIHTTSLNVTEWLMIFGASFTVLLFDEIRKVFVRRKFIHEL